MRSLADAPERLQEGGWEGWRGWSLAAGPACTFSTRVLFCVPSVPGSGGLTGHPLCRGCVSTSSQSPAACGLARAAWRGARARKREIGGSTAAPSCSSVRSDKWTTGGCTNTKCRAASRQVMPDSSASARWNALEPARYRAGEARRRRSLAGAEPGGAGHSPHPHPHPREGE